METTRSTGQPAQESDYEGTRENYTCAKCGLRMVMDRAPPAPSGWSVRDWEAAVAAAMEDGECPLCAYVVPGVNQ